MATNDISLAQAEEGLTAAQVYTDLNGEGVTASACHDCGDDDGASLSQEATFGKEPQNSESNDCSNNNFENNNDDKANDDKKGDEGENHKDPETQSASCEGDNKCACGDDSTSKQEEGQPAYEGDPTKLDADGSVVTEVTKDILLSEDVEKLMKERDELKTLCGTYEEKLATLEKECGELRMQVFKFECEERVREARSLMASEQLPQETISMIEAKCKNGEFKSFEEVKTCVALAVFDCIHKSNVEHFTTSIVTPVVETPVSTNTKKTSDSVLNDFVGKGSCK